MLEHGTLLRSAAVLPTMSDAAQSPSASAVASQHSVHSAAAQSAVASQPAPSSAATAAPTATVASDGVHTHQPQEEADAAHHDTAWALLSGPPNEQRALAAVHVSGEAVLAVTQLVKQLLSCAKGAESQELSVYVYTGAIVSALHPLSIKGSLRLMWKLPQFSKNCEDKYMQRFEHIASCFATAEDREFWLANKNCSLQVLKLLHTYQQRIDLQAAKRHDVWKAVLDHIHLFKRNAQTGAAHKFLQDTFGTTRSGRHSAHSQRSPRLCRC
jgi:hypothetical protein